VADEDAIDKNSGAIGVHIELNFGGYRRHLNPAIALHGHADDLLFAGLDADFLREVQITALPDYDFVFTWQEEDLFGPLQFLQITKILPIDPYSGRSLYFGGAQELNFTQYIVSSVQKRPRKLARTGDSANTSKIELGENLSYHYLLRSAPVGQQIVCRCDARNGFVFYSLNPRCRFRRSAAGKNYTPMPLGKNFSNVGSV
jgi:hypothetical protein